MLRVIGSYGAIGSLGGTLEAQSRIIKAKTANGAVIQVEATVRGGEQDIAARIPSFENVMAAVEEISIDVLAALQKAKPRKATVQFGVEVGAESGQLTALLVKGTGKANLQITLEWGQ